MQKQFKYNRRSLLAMAHMAAKNLFSDDRDQYEAYLLKHTGYKSCNALNDVSLARLVDQFKKDGGLPQKTASSNRKAQKGGVAYDRPTDLQRAKLAALSRDMGWDGLNDEALFKFVERTAGVKALRFLTRAQISQIITGLEKWRDEILLKENI